MIDPPADGAADLPIATKDALRRDALARRDRLAPEHRARAGERIADLITDLALPSGSIVSGFWPIRGEIDPRPAMARLAVRGHPLALPALLADRSAMVFRRWTAGDRLVPAAFGLSEPAAEAEEVDPTVLLMPLAAFDRRGGRIGYGGGWYDRVLARLERSRPVLKIGLGFAAQEVARVPEEAHDRRLDLILTEDGPIVPAGDAS
ncbi:MAG: 5-formyltetrahydrofolate cyclo-ligase [Siculibacillus sp.]|nr:5-formyltetrahydrofolate cyclo-ligase [Siculibacillus sp.]